MRPPTPPETVAAIIADYRNGLSTVAIGRKYGISDSTAHRYVMQAGINRPRRPARACMVQGCATKHKARGYCGKHLTRFERYGDPLLGRGPNEPTDEQIGRLEDLRWMAETGESLDGASERLGIGRKTIEAFLRRNDPDCLGRLLAREPRDHNRIIYGESTTALSGLSQQRRARKQRAA